MMLSRARSSSSFSSFSMWRFVVTASCLLACLSSKSNLFACAAKQIDVTDWAVPSGDATSLPPQTAEVGDTAVFTWIFGRIHNVYIHPSKDCTLADRIEVGLETGVSYTFTDVDAEAGELFFCCDAFDHCNFGLHVTFTVTKPGAAAAGGGAASSAVSSTSMVARHSLQFLGLLVGGSLWLIW
jgi:plastocyanin